MNKSAPKGSWKALTVGLIGIVAMIVLGDLIGKFLGATAVTWLWVIFIVLAVLGAVAVIWGNQIRSWSEKRTAEETPETPAPKPDAEAIKAEAKAEAKAELEAEAKAKAEEIAKGITWKDLVLSSKVSFEELKKLHDAGYSAEEISALLSKGLTVDQMLAFSAGLDEAAEK